MIIGYIRVSRDDQTTALQEDAMQREQCERIFTDKMSGARDDRPQFMAMVHSLRKGDIVVVWRLDRLGRSLKHLIETVNLLHQMGVELKSVKENIDTTTSTGKLMFHIMGAMAEFERDVIRERTVAGLDAARARGHKGGRPMLDISGKSIKRARELYAKREMTVKEIMDTVGIKNKGTFYKYVVHNGTSPVSK